MSKNFKGAVKIKIYYCIKENGNEYTTDGGLFFITNENKKLFGNNYIPLVVIKDDIGRIYDAYFSIGYDEKVYLKFKEKENGHVFCEIRDLDESLYTHILMYRNGKFLEKFD